MGQRRKLLTGFQAIAFVAMLFVNVLAQRPQRSKPPVFEPSDFAGVFFPDVRSAMRGTLPTAGEVVAQTPNPSGGAKPDESKDAADPLAWPKLVSPSSVEDLIKGAKLRLDGIVTTPPAFVSGGYAVARREFSLLAVLFAVIEEYPGEIRWKESSASAREMLARAAANAKIGSLPVFNEAKNRLLDLGDLLRGTALAEQAKSDVDWSTLIDRPPLMQLLDWASEDQLSDLLADDDSFTREPEAATRYAELIGILGKVSLAREMPDADDEDYRKLALDMINGSKQVVSFIKQKDIAAARKALGVVSQSCDACHADYR